MGEPLTDGVTSIMLLPDDCLSSVFNRLDCRADHESFGLTCRRWLNIQNLNRRSLQFACSFSIVGSSLLSQSNIDINSFHLLRILTRFQHLEYLTLSGCIELPDSGLNYLKSYGSRLCCLKLCRCDVKIKAEEVMLIRPNWDSLDYDE